MKAKLVGIKDQLFAALYLVAHQKVNHVDLQNMFGKERGKQLSDLIEIDQRFWHLGTRFASLKKLESLDYKKLASLVKRIDEVSDDEIMKFFDLREPVNKVRMMPRKRIEMLTMGFPVNIISDSFRAIAEDNMDRIDKYVKHADAINAAVNEIMK
jgi:hypothetical protein